MCLAPVQEHKASKENAAGAAPTGAGQVQLGAEPAAEQATERAHDVDDSAAAGADEQVPPCPRLPPATCFEDSLACVSTTRHVVTCVTERGCRFQGPVMFQTMLIPRLAAEEQLSQTKI